MAAQAETLTQYLMARGNAHFQQATRHPFLERAGDGTLSASTLVAWLAQDMHYQRGYIRFVGGLLSQISLPATNPQQSTKNVWKELFGLLLGALNGLQREIDFFEQTVQKYELGELFGSDTRVAPMETNTKAYVGLFESFGRDGIGSLLEGIVVLWATEKCYLEAWTFAASVKQSSQSKDTQDAKAHAALSEAFIPNWSSDEFKGFVQTCEDMVNALAAEFGVSVSSLRAHLEHQLHKDEGCQAVDGCMRTFEQVLRLETRFWPSV